MFFLSDFCSLQNRFNSSFSFSWQVRVAIVTVVLALLTLLAQHKIHIHIIDNHNTHRHAKWLHHLMHKFKRSNDYFNLWPQKIGLHRITWFFSVFHFLIFRFAQFFLIRLNYIFYIIIPIIFIWDTYAIGLQTKYMIIRWQMMRWMGDAMRCVGRFHFHSNFGQKQFIRLHIFCDRSHPNAKLNSVADIKVVVIEYKYIIKEVGIPFVNFGHVAWRALLTR